MRPCSASDSEASAAIRAAMQKVKYDGWLVAEMESRYRYAVDQQFYDTAAAIDRLISGRL